METFLTYGKDSLKYQKKIIFNAGIESSIGYFDPQTTFAHKVQLLFAPFGLPFIPLEIIGTDASNIVSSFTWTKDRTNPGGLFSVELQPDSSAVKDMVDIINKISGNLYSKIWGTLGVDLEDLFKPMTLCQLWIDGYHVMTGTVRSCKRNTRVGQKDFSNSYSLMIDELGNIYTKNTLRLDTIFLDMQLEMALDSTTKALEKAANLKMIPLQTGIKILVDAFLTTVFAEQGFNASDGLPIALRMLATPNPLGAIAWMAFGMNIFCNVQMFELNGQSFWDFLKTFVPTPWMEFYTESGGRTIVTEPTSGIPSVLFPGFNYIVSRSVPYSNPLLGIVNPAHIPALLPYDLTAIAMLAGGDFVIITDDDVQEKSLGFDCSAQATSFRSTYGSGTGMLAVNEQDRPIQTAGPINPFASGGMNTFGKIEKIQAINCVQMYDAGLGADMITKMAQDSISIPGLISKPALSNLLAVWFRNQCRFREGEITTRIIPHARPGMYLLYLPTFSGKKPDNLRDIGIYYIDSLNHHCNTSDKDVSAQTTFNVIRGVPLPTTLAQTALLLFDYEVLPPISGLWDGEFLTINTARRILRGAS